MVIFRGGADSQGVKCLVTSVSVNTRSKRVSCGFASGRSTLDQKLGRHACRNCLVDQGVVMFGQTTEYFKCYSFAAKMEFLN